MARATEARRRALALLGELRRRDARARDLLRASSELDELSERDRGFAVRLVMGVTAAQGELDRVIESHLRRGAKLEPRVRDALRLAAFDLLYLGARPDVGVNQGVELVRGVAPRAAGLANAVLRRVAEKDVATLAASRGRVADGSFSASDLARVGALPKWLCECAMASLDAGEAAAWAERALEPAASWVAVNRARTERERSLFKKLEEAGCSPEEGPLSGSILLGAPARLAASGLVESADVLPCDLAAQEVALSCEPAPGERVLEVGQGRGTKTVLLEGAAVAAGGPCQIVAVESDERRSARSVARMEAAGVADHVRCVCADGRELDASLGSFELVFVDAPCTGTGTLSRHPEIAWSLEEDAPEKLSFLQGELLAAAAARVAAGGRLVYATCSVLAEENERVVEAFLASPAGAGFELVRAERTAWPHADTHFHAHFSRSDATARG